MSTRIGNRAETDARDYLEKQGLVWEDSNYRCQQGEIDLIMHDQDTLVFVEVRFRSHPHFGIGIETISKAKQYRIIKAAWHYLMEQRLVDKIHCRFDVIGLNLNDEICWIPNAFEVEY